MQRSSPRSFPLPKRNLKNSSGFSLLEILVAIAILGVALITLFELFSGSLKLARSSEDYLKATLLAQKKINDLRLENFYLQEAGESGEFEEDPAYQWSVTIEPYETEFKRSREKETIKKIDLTVFWKVGGKQKSFSLVRLYNPMIWNGSE